MIEWLGAFLSSATAKLVFFGIFAAGLIITGFSVLLGGDADTDYGADTSVDHDTDTDDGHGLGGLLSVRGAALFGIGFGGIGYVVMVYTGKVLFASVSGMLSGFLMAFLGLAFIRIFYRQQASSLIEPKQLKDAVGMVTTSIPAHGLGEVCFTAGGIEISRSARSENGGAIEAGTRVTILDSLGGVVTVKGA